ncbi:hypothetical protein [Vulgatibacter sp.]|uniref:hypothetical protein n=1 Tax=Vulgatibacter sp. TaxID=1971226 RepID=UPI003566785A
MTAPGDTAVRALGWLQHELQHVQAVETGHRVEDFVVSRSGLEQMGLKAPKAEEEVLVVEERGELSVAVYLAPRVLEALRTAGRNLGALFTKHFPTLCLAIEGVSHFVYLTSRAEVLRPVSLLELEVQAEIDKFALAALFLWRRGQRHEVPALLDRLFGDVSYLPHLGPEELERYRTANRLARGYCRELLRYVEQGRVEPLLAELRRSYRLGAGEKYSRLNRALH